MTEREGLPIYQKIRMQIYKDISAGSLKVGGLIPSESDLMRIYNASRTTVRKAIESLTREGLILRKRGLGSFVQKDIAEAKVRLRGSFEDILAVVQRTTAKVLNFEYVEAGPEVSRNLKLVNESKVLRIDRVRSINNTPFLYSSNYLPDAIGQQLSKKDLEEFALIHLIPQKLQIPIVKARQNFGATIANSMISEKLGIPIGVPLLEIERVTMTSNDVPVNLFYGYFRSDIYKFTTSFTF